MLLAVRTLFFFVLLTGCGRTGFEGSLPDGSGGDGGSNNPGGDADDPTGDADPATPPVCGTLTTFGARTPLAALPAGTSLTLTLNFGASYVTNGIYGGGSVANATALAYRDDLDTWESLDTLTFGSGTVINGSIGTTSTALFHTTSYADGGSPFQWYVRRSVSGNAWTTVDSTNDNARSIDIETPSDAVIVHALLANGGQIIRRSNDGGTTWAQADGANASIVPRTLSVVQIGTLMSGTRTLIPQGTAWVVRYSEDPLANVWQELGTWYPTTGANTSATVAFFIPGITGTFIAGSIDDGAGRAFGRISHFSEDGQMTIVDDFVVADSFVEPARRAIHHSGGCTLVLERVQSSSAVTTRIRGSSDGVTWVDLTPAANDVSLNSVVELVNGDLLANTGSGLVRYPAIFN